MARKVGKRDSRYLAKLVTENRAPCAFCHREVDDEVTYGKLYAIGDIQCHYFCALLSCCLVQKGPEEDGLFGFMYKDIMSELERSKKHKCSYCSKGGANLGCSISSCRKQFHLPCGRERNAVSLYFGTYKSFCKLHAPKQSIPDHIMSRAKLRMKGLKVPSTQGDESTEDMVCVICYEAVDAFPTVNTFWPPCCGKDAWFHRTCLERMALSAGMHYLKCPLCNDKQNFYDAVIDQGYYVPDRDAAWELEQNAFAEIYERPLNCTVETCECPMGRNHDADQGEWDIKLCLLCGSVGAHAHCIGASETTRYVCLTCTPAAPEDIQTLADNIEKLILQEQATTAAPQRGPVMPSRMSLRRTKGRPAIATRPSSSRRRDVKTECENTQSPQTIASRQDLNLPTPRKFTQPIKPDSNSPYKTRPLEVSHINELSSKTSELFKRLKSPLKISRNNGSPYKCIEALDSLKLYESLNNEDSYENEMDKLMSPMKLLEKSLYGNVCMEVKDLDEEVVDLLRKKFRKPGPLSAKRKIIEDILTGLISTLNTSDKQKEQLREWCSPRKGCDITKEILPREDTTSTEHTGETTENNIMETPKKCTRHHRNKSDTDEESQKSSENIDLITETNIDNNTMCEQLDNKIISEDKNYHGKDESIKIVEPEESRGASLGMDIDDASNSTFQIPPEYVADPQSDNSNDLIATETKIDNNSEQLDNKVISEDKNDHGKDESIKIVEPEESSGASLGMNIDDSSNSKFQLPPEFVADPQSDNSNASLTEPKTIDAIYSPKKDPEVKSDACREIKDDGNKDDLEAKCAFKFSPLDSEKLEKNNVDISLERFKKNYLSEVGKNKCAFDKNGKRNVNLSSIIDFAVDAHLKKQVDTPKKRKLSEGKIVLVFNKDDAKKRKLSEKDSNLSSSDDFEDKKETISPKKEKLKIVFLSKRNEKKRIKDKAKKENILRRKTRDEIKIADKTIITEEKEKTFKDIGTEKKKSKDTMNPDNASGVSNKSDIGKEIGPPKRKFHESSQWLAEITELDKKLEIEARKNERNLKKKKLETSRKDATTNIQNKYSQDNKTDKQNLNRNCKNKKFVREIKEVTSKANAKSQDGVIKKEKISKHKKEKLPRRQKRQYKLDKKYKKDKKHKEKYEESKENDQNIELTIDSSENTLKENNKIKKKLSIRKKEKDISMKIKWKKKQLRLKNKESKEDKINKKDNDSSKFKQYVLQYFSEITPKKVLIKPEKDVSPLKRKYVKQDKTPDKLKQMSIQSFFKTTFPN